MDSPRDVTVKVIVSEPEITEASVSTDTAAAPHDDFLAVTPASADPGPQVELFDADLAHDTGSKRMKRTKGSDENVAMYALLALINKKGAVRSLKCLPEAWREILDNLQSDFPNFAEVVDYLRGQFSLGDPGKPIVTFEPLLLDGSPGVGKSFFAEELGRRLDVPCKAIRMENAQSNARLVGSDEFWSNSKPGAIFDTLMQGDIANPLFFLDEVEKAAGHSRYDPISGLYSLLERATAKSFVDLSWPWLELDASHVNWIFASNDVGLLPEPIRSRIRIFSIPAPTSAQGQRIAVKMFRQLQREIFVAKDIRLTWGAVRVLSGYPPRTIKKRLREAIGRAAYEQRRHIREQDLRDMETQLPKRSIGFVAG